jgi:multiple sugar transport system substrate-binding protein
MFASGNAADVFMVNNPDFPSFANSGNLLALSGQVDAGYFDSFFPGVNGMYVWQGEQMAIPFTTDCRILWYNKDLFTAAGLDPASPPKTWEELVSYAKQIEEKTDAYGFGMDLGLQEFPTQALYCASGGDIINVADDGSITPNVNTPEFKGYLNTLLDMKPTFEADYTILDHHDVAKLFVEGQMGIIIGNTLNDTDIYDKEWYAQGLIPSIDGSTNGSFGGGFGISVSSECKYPAQAVRFAQIITSPEFCAKLISDVPASEEGIAQSEMAKDPIYSLYLEQMQYARQAQPKTLYYAEFDMAVYDTVTEVLVGGTPVDDAVAALENNIKTISGQ